MLFIKDGAGSEGRRVARQNTEVPIYVELCCVCVCVCVLNAEALERRPPNAGNELHSLLHLFNIYLFS